MTRLPFDPEDPPVKPPLGADPLVWGLAYGLFEAHQPDRAGLCQVCHPVVVWPCGPSRLAGQGLVAALGGPDGSPGVGGPTVSDGSDGVVRRRPLPGRLG